MKPSNRNDKVKTQDEISGIVKNYKKRGLVVGLGTGCFDIVHSGHIDLFHFAKEYFLDVIIWKK
jgi:bifunctional ADP-heptose synthase (sugar kinase/adenylyltransferase)